MFRRKDILKAVALAIYVKEHSTSSLVKNWSVNKIHSLSGLGATTVKKRLQTLRLLDLTKECGPHLLFARLKSSCDRNNIDIPATGNASVKEIEKCLMALLVALIQRQKDYVNLQLQRVNNGMSLKDIKKARRERKRYGWRSFFEENGLSYKGIAKRLGICVKTAFEVVKFGIRKGFFKKISHFLCLRDRGAANLTEVPDGWTFISKKGNLFKVFSNTYILSRRFSILGNN